jgi:hypothetical protein
MKFTKVLCLLLALSICSVKASAPDEGMWIPSLIGKNYEELKKLGFKLTAEDIYNINQASLKDAIVSLGFCTGEIISNQGLMLTNHHCGYGSIQYHSSVDHDYLSDGFYAKTQADELSSPEVTASMLVRMEDVTSKLEAATKNKKGAEFEKAKAEEIEKIIAAAKAENENYTCNVKDLFGGNQYFLFVYEKYLDVRLVYAPPASIGKFGGDTDNWMWPRHTGDFSIFRIYMSKDGKPAAYSKDNVPFKPKKFLPISTKGLAEGDFTMIMGYPGRTNRYAFSRELTENVNVTNPAIIQLLDTRLKVMKSDMDQDKSIKIKLADGYASMANGWKYYLGQNEGLKKLDVIQSKKKYEGLFRKVDESYDAYKPFLLNNLYLNLAGYATSTSQYAASFLGLLASLESGDTAKVAKQTAALKEGVDEHFKDYVWKNEQKVFQAMSYLYLQNMPSQNRPKVINDMDLGSQDQGKAIEKYTEELFTKSIFISRENVLAFLEKPSLETLKKDPFVLYAQSLNEFRKTYQEASKKFNEEITEYKRQYIEGLMAMNKDSKMFYPDANSTMRITYGKMAAYSPKDGMEYDIYTTADGIVKKYKKGDDEFDVPVKLIDLIKAKNYGAYANKDGELPVAFISDNDITGGNSGSPVINGNGELVGVAFDGNWEAMTGDLVFDKAFKRTISVDIRYVLFVMDKYSGAGKLIEEMEIRK